MDIFKTLDMEKYVSSNVTIRELVNEGWITVLKENRKYLDYYLTLDHYKKLVIKCYGSCMMYNQGKVCEALKKRMHDIYQK